MTDTREIILEVWNGAFIVGAFDKNSEKYLEWDEIVEILNLPLNLDE